MIGDIEDISGRATLVYFSQLNHAINRFDADDFSEIIDGCQSKSVDIILNTPGGEVDAVEKLISILKQRLNDYRIIVPSVAKSGGTVIGLSAKSIVLGVNSELGPIDPQFMMPGMGPVPCEFVAQDQTQNAIMRQIAESAVKRMSDLATRILSDGMLKGEPPEKVADVVNKLSSSHSYKSHGAVIDYDEAKSLGINVEKLAETDELWRKIWLLYCCYDYDCNLKGYGKIFEGASNSLAKRRAA